LVDGSEEGIACIMVSFRWMKNRSSNDSAFTTFQLLLSRLHVHDNSSLSSLASTGTVTDRRFVHFRGILNTLIQKSDENQPEKVTQTVAHLSTDKVGKLIFSLSDLWLALESIRCSNHAYGGPRS
jgi:hypothetical protein